MNEQQLYRVIKGSHTTEKSVRMADKHHQIVFRVASLATKRMVKMAVEQHFAVKVTAVQMVRIPGKRKHFKQLPGKRSDYKKAYVTLAEGYDINLANFQ